MADSSESACVAPLALNVARSEPARLTGATEKASLRQMLNAHFATVRRFLRRFGVEEASLDDAAQEVFIVAARRLEEIELGRERPYLYGIALRIAANARRAQTNLRDYTAAIAVESAPAQPPAPDALLERKELRALLDRLLAMLPDEQRAAFVLFELEGFSVPEIAELCGIPLGTASSRLRRAREAFQAETARLKRNLPRTGGLP